MCIICISFDYTGKFKSVHHCYWLVFKPFVAKINAIPGRWSLMRAEVKERPWVQDSDLAYVCWVTTSVQNGIRHVDRLSH